MIEKGRISARQAIYLVANTILATMILFLPSLLAREAGQDGWLAVLLAGAAGMLVGLLVVDLGLRFPDRNFAEYTRELLGPYLGGFLTVALALFFFYVCGVIVREFGELLATAVMPETPLAAFHILIVALAAYGAYLGLEVFARAGEIVFPISLFLGLAILAMALPDLDPTQVLPAFVHPFSSVARAALGLVTFYGEGTVFLFFLPCLRRPREAWRVVAWVPPFLTFAMLLSFLGVVSLFGVEESARLIFPTFEFAKTVRFAGFLERVESLVVGIWVMTVGIKVTTIFYTCVLALAEVLRLRDYRPLILPLSVWLVALSLLQFRDVIHLREFLGRFIGPFGLTFQLGIPFFVWAAALLRGKRRRSLEEGEA